MKKLIKLRAFMTLVLLGAIMTLGACDNIQFLEGQIQRLDSKNSEPPMPPAPVIPPAPITTTSLLSISDGAAVEGNNITFTVSLSEASSEAVSFSYSTARQHSH